MPRIRLRPRAAKDLDAIWNYTASRWDSAQAERYVRAIWSVISRLPEGSTDAAQLLPGLRRVRAGAHHAYFLQQDGEIDVIRILHERQSAPDRIDEA